MPYFPRTEKDIIADSLQRLNQNTNITQMTPGGKARFFISTFGREQGKLSETFDTNLLQAFIKYCDNKFLDFFGDMFNRPRVEASHAEARNNNMMFYVTSGTFGDINAGSSFTVPAGTTVYTKRFEGQIFTPGLEEQLVINYTTLNDVVCQSNASYVYVPIRAEVEGTESSVPRATLTEHNFDGYSLSSNNSLKCTNRFAIDNGIDREENDHYRYRLSKVFDARQQAVKAAIRLAALSVSGVVDVTEVNCEQGPGSYTLIIQGVTPTVSPDLVTAVATRTEQVTGYGNRGFVMGARGVGLEFVASVAWSPRATTEQIALGYQAMRDATETKINSLKADEKLDMQTIIDTMLNAAPLALYIGRDTPNKFDEVYVYRQSANGEGTTKSLLLTDEIDPLYNERIILETSTRYRGIHFITIGN